MSKIKVFYLLMQLLVFSTSSFAMQSGKIATKDEERVGKKRRQVSVACDHCRKNKIGCDNDKVCKNCSLRGRPCVRNIRGKRRGQRAFSNESYEFSNTDVFSFTSFTSFDSTTDNSCFSDLVSNDGAANEFTSEQLTDNISNSTFESGDGNISSMATASSTSFLEGNSNSAFSPIQIPPKIRTEYAPISSSSVNNNNDSYYGGCGYLNKSVNAPCFTGMTIDESNARILDDIGRLDTEKLEIFVVHLKGYRAAVSAANEHLKEMTRILNDQRNHQ